MQHEHMHHYFESTKNALPRHMEGLYPKAFATSWDVYQIPEERRGDMNGEQTTYKLARQRLEKSYQKNEFELWLKKGRHDET